MDRADVFLAAGTLRLMFSRASRLSAWKSGWRNVHDCGCVVSFFDDDKREKRTCMFAKLVVVGVLDFVEVVLVQLPHERRKVGVLEHARKDGFREFVHILQTSLESNE